MGMSKVSEIASSVIGDSISNIKNWGNVFYNAQDHGVFPGGADVTTKLQYLVNLAKSTGRTSIFLSHGDYYVTGLTNDDGIYFFGDNAKFVGGYDRVIYQMGNPSVERGKSSPMTYNYTPNRGGLLQFIQGDDTQPSTAGVVPSVYIQRVDRSLTADDPGHLITPLYVAHKRLPGGTGWLYSGLFYLEDQSNTGTAQSAAVAGMAYAKNKTAVWGVYGDAYKFSSEATITGAEFDSQNHSGVHDFYNDANPVGVPFSCGVWLNPAGGAISSFGLGVGGGAIPNIFDCGIYIKSALNYGIDVQATPQTIIRFKNGAKRASDQTFNGIGLDTGINANYGIADHTGAIHLWSNKLAFGDIDDYGYMKYNDTNKYLEFYFGGVRRGYLDLSGTDHAL
ncbi:hypothetical protein XI25_29640 [Paenibacillus sp. DMB20]|nr:hypothetical protein XI25_29640 [Paenibacillus sp. DMB20]